MTHVNSLIVVADRGSLRAYRVDPLPDRAPRLSPVVELDLTVARGHLSDTLSDRAGQFGARETGGRPGPGQSGGGGAAEQPTIELENDRRAVKQLAAHIAEALRDQHPAGWSLAAPKQILPLLLEHLPKEWTNKIVEKVGADLAKVRAGELFEHFESLRRDRRHAV